MMNEAIATASNVTDTEIRVQIARLEERRTKLGNPREDWRGQFPSEVEQASSHARRRWRDGFAPKVLEVEGIDRELAALRGELDRRAVERQNRSAVGVDSTR